MRRLAMTLAPAQTNSRGMRLGLVLCVALLLAGLVNVALPLGVEAAPKPKASYSTRTLYFGYQGVGVTSAPMTVTLKSPGNHRATVSSVSITGANAGDFAIASNSCPP